MLRRTLEAPAGAGERMTWSSEDDDNEPQPAQTPAAVKKRASKQGESYQAAVSKAETEEALASIANGPQKIRLDD